jgi:KaiC/GvpD/RAD55 family RecA-like ATPase
VATERVEFIVDGLVPSRGVTIFSGEGGIGKSFIALDMALAVASGGDFAKIYPCRKGGVLYVDLENDESTLGRRLVQLARGRELDVDALEIHVPKRGQEGVELEIDTPDGRAWLRTAVKRYSPCLLVVDSLIAAHRSDESNNVMMRQLMAGLDSIARSGELGLVVVHHQRKRGTVNDAGQLMRGASDLRNAVVSHFAARRGKSGVILIEHDKCRPCRPVDVFGVRLEDRPDGGVAVCLVGTGQAAVKAGNDAGAREDAVLEVLGAKGPMRGSALIQAMGCPERTGMRTLRDMVTRGEILKWPDGLYRLTEKGAGSAEAVALGGLDFDSEDSGGSEGAEEEGTAEE